MALPYIYGTTKPQWVKELQFQSKLRRLDWHAMLMLGFLAETKKRNIGEVLSRYFTTSMPAPAYQGDETR